MVVMVIIKFQAPILKSQTWRDVYYSGHLPHIHTGIQVMTGSPPSPTRRIGKVQRLALPCCVVDDACP